MEPRETSLQYINPFGETIPIVLLGVIDYEENSFVSD